jgi:hypothetical protein
MAPDPREISGPPQKDHGGDSGNISLVPNDSVNEEGNGFSIEASEVLELHNVHATFTRLAF